MGFKNYVLIILIAIIMINYYFGIGIIIVSGNSMSPTYESGDLVVYTKTYKDINTGDVVIYLDKTGDVNNSSYIIKRVLDVKDDQLFLEGDNQQASIDSNEFGYVDIEGVVGKAI